jgi:ATP-dependent RNA helicase RhlE
MSFLSFGLHESIMQGIYDSGYENPTEIQRKAIPPALQGRDVIGCAPTGTGKTAAFVLPVLNRLTQCPDSEKYVHPFALILTPTRELALQIEDSIKTYGSCTPVRTVCVYGGVSLENQVRALRKGCDIVVATPGRLLDHLNRRSVSLGAIDILVLDEADRMFDMGFIHDVRKIISYVPTDRQTLLFSATMSPEIKKLISGIQKKPVLVEIGSPNTPVSTVDQQFYAAARNTKLDLLVHILKKETIETMLVFSRTKHGADRIARRLAQNGVSSAALHADRSQSQRRKALDGFKRRRFKVLVATDIAARGLDIDKISHVVNFDTPAFAEDYIHRIGRTGRAQATGTAVTFVDDEEKKFLKRIEYLTGNKFEVIKYPGFDYPELEKTESVPLPRNWQAFQRKMRRYRP